MHEPDPQGVANQGAHAFVLWWPLTTVALRQAEEHHRKSHHACKQAIPVDGRDKTAPPTLTSSPKESMIIGNEGPLSQQQHEAIELFETAIQWGMCTAQPTVATWCQETKMHR